MTHTTSPEAPITILDALEVADSITAANRQLLAEALALPTEELKEPETTSNGTVINIAVASAVGAATLAPALSAAASIPAEQKVVASERPAQVDRADKAPAKGPEFKTITVPRGDTITHQAEVAKTTGVKGTVKNLVEVIEAVNSIADPAMQWQAGAREKVPVAEKPQHQEHYTGKHRSQYTVKEGDISIRIAARYHESLPILIRDNEAKLAPSHGNLIMPGEKLWVRTHATNKQLRYHYTEFKSGDTVYESATKQGLDWSKVADVYEKAFLQLNEGVTDINKVQANHKYKLPTKSYVETLLKHHQTSSQAPKTREHAPHAAAQEPKPNHEQKSNHAHVHQHVERYVHLHQKVKKLSFEVVKHALPNASNKNIRRNSRLFLKAMREMHINDAQMIAYGLGTISAEDSGFVASISEYGGGSQYEGRVALGNIYPGDGDRYKGRSPIQITGRNNYRYYGERIDEDLEGNPELANRPDIAWKLVAVFLEDRKQHIRDALDAGDFALARSYVNGGTNGLDRFVTGYKAALNAIGEDQAQEADQNNQDSAGPANQYRNGNNDMSANGQETLPDGTAILKQLKAEHDDVSGELSGNELERLGDTWGDASLNPAAAQSFRQMNDAFKAQFGRDIQVNDSYRSYDRQVQMKDEKGNFAATPGTSDHGWGLAIDMGGGIENFDSQEHKWMVENAHQFGFNNPKWADDGVAPDEAWHWEFAGSGNPDDM